MLFAKCCNYTKCLPPSLPCSFQHVLAADINCLCRNSEVSGSSPAQLCLHSQQWSSRQTAGLLKSGHSLRLSQGAQQGSSIGLA